MPYWIPDLSRSLQPKYRALADAIAEAIQQGVLTPGMRLPTHRALAQQLGLPVSTITRGYNEAQRRLLIEPRMGSGTYVRATCETATASPMALSAQLSRLSTQVPINLDFNLALAVGQEHIIAEVISKLCTQTTLIKQLIYHQPTLGMLRHRAIVAHWLEDRGYPGIDPQHILLSTGAMNGAFTALLALRQQTHILFCDGLTYPGILGAAQQLGYQVIGIGMDSDGMIAEQLQQQCKRYPGAVLYLMPSLNNPTNVQMSDARIQAIAQISQDYRLHIIEDDTQNSLLHRQSLHLKNLLPEQTTLVSSCTKTLGDGLRVGFMVSPPSLLSAVTDHFRASTWLTAPLVVEIVCQLIESGQMHHLLTQQSQLLQQRRALLLDRLQTHLSTPLQIRCAPGSLFAWIQLPPPWRAAHLTHQAQMQDVLIKPADLFAAGHYRAPQAVRLCLGGETSLSHFVQAIEVIQSILQQPQPQPLIFA